APRAAGRVRRARPPRHREPDAERRDHPARRRAAHAAQIAVLSLSRAVCLRRPMAPSARRLGVIGAGNIGGAVAANLLADGHAVAVHDTAPARSAALVRAGAVRADTPAAVAERSEITFTSLPTP